MFPIQRNYWTDLKAAKATPGLMDNCTTNPCKLDLYRFIANYIGAYWQTDSVDELYQNIDDRNAELACVGVPEVKRPVFVKPVKRCDRKPVAKPVKPPAIKLTGNLQLATMRPVKVAKPKLKVKVN